ncbi:uncharacterized protein At5g01610-like [Hibiscus syriacus]|uniref:uncharacterized protein At5g01610-like n=1 Tax=Hibiscus syriacus TaxID=106335 RepID=UPI001922FA88|nr:uncharacterized protein At5g01610-like [Hibiscus syriacus]
MDQMLNKVGHKAEKQLSSVGDEIEQISNIIGGGTKWLVNKIKGTIQKPLPELLKEYDLPTDIFSRDATNYEKLMVFIPAICDVSAITSDGSKLYVTAGITKTRCSDAYEISRDGVGVDKF